MTSDFFPRNSTRGQNASNRLTDEVNRDFKGVFVFRGVTETVCNSEERKRVQRSFLCMKTQSDLDETIETYVRS